MPFNSNEIIQDIRQEFEKMIKVVQDSQDATADEMERELFKRLLQMGGQLLVLFFTLRSEEQARESIENEVGEQLPYFGDKKRSYYSIFGKLPIFRPYFYRQGVGSDSPLDEQLSLGSDCYSDLLREMAEYLGVETAYEKVIEIFGRLLGQALSPNAVTKMVAEDAAYVAAYYAQKPTPTADSEATILVIQSDGKGVPMIRETETKAKVRLGKGEKRTKKKEAVVTTIYTIEPHPRTPEEVVASYFHPDQSRSDQGQRPKERRPQNKHLWATLEGKDKALQRLAVQVQVRQGTHIQQQVALADGCEALQKRLQDYFPDFTLILDFIHANEYLWKAANKLFTEQDPKRPEWVEAQTLKMLSGQTQQVIDILRHLAQKPKTTKAQRQQLEASANYFERNLPYMHYDRYLKQGWPIASGVIEGACRHFVKDRFELSGMRWSQPGAEHMLHLRAVAENGDWDEFHLFRRQQRHFRLYRQSLFRPDQIIPEQQALSPSAYRLSHPTPVRLSRPGSTSANLAHLPLAV